VIKESCGCGATFEVIQGFVDREDQAVAIWRREHKHDWDSHIQNVISDISPTRIHKPDCAILTVEYPPGPHANKGPVVCDCWYPEPPEPTAMPDKVHRG
jgi:hypothetical protein